MRAGLDDLAQARVAGGREARPLRRQERDSMKGTDRADPSSFTEASEDKSLRSG
jgi:hypothetical protein